MTEEEDAEYWAWYKAMLPGAMIYASGPCETNWEEAFARARAGYDAYLDRCAGIREIDWFALNREVSD